MDTNENFIANKKAMTLTTILKKEAENEDESAEYLRVIRFVKAIQKAPIKGSFSFIKNPLKKLKQKMF